MSVASPGKYVQNGIRDLLRYATLIEELGFHTISMGEHLVVSPAVEARGNQGWYTEQVLWPDPLVTFGALAAVTERVRLCTSIYLAPLRPAVAVAKMAATVDAMSGGRLTLGVGAGWLESEFTAAGVPFRERFRRLDDTVRACQVLWRDAPATFSSRTVTFEGISCLPHPVQPGGPPILFAGDPGGPMAGRIAEMGSGWIVRSGALTDPDEEAARITEDLAAIRAAVAAAGRDPGGLLFQIGTLARRDSGGRIDLDASLAQVRRYWDLGIGLVQISLAQFVESPAEVGPFLREVARALIP